MKNYYIDQPISLCEHPLKPRWANRHYKIKGESIISFTGPFHTKFLTYTKKTGNPIDQDQDIDQMLHIIIEHKKNSLKEIELQRRLFATILHHSFGSEFQRQNSTLYFQGIPLNVSIVSHAIRTSIIYFGFFIEPNTETLPFLGIEQFDINPKTFACSVMQAYCKEQEEIIKTITKK